MYYSQLLKLSEVIKIGDEEIQKIDAYLYSLTDNIKKNITATRLSAATGISPDVAMKILYACTTKDIRLLKMHYAIICPECGTRLKRIDDIQGIPDSPFECYSCEQDIEIDEKDIEVQFSLEDHADFCKGQHDQNYSPPAGRVALNDSLKALLTVGPNLNTMFFSPNDDQYTQLEESYKKIFNEGKTTEVGNTLEDLILELFNLSTVLIATGIKTEINQIDCFVRNKMYVDYGIFKLIGGRFLIECKNEKGKPSGSYISKLESIISCTNCQGTEYIKFGIIVSKKPAPSTYLKHAREYYLIKGIVIISICGNELEELIKQKGNLFELLERKADEVIIKATTDLKKAGLYSD